MFLLLQLFQLTGSQQSSQLLRRKAPFSMISRGTEKTHTITRIAATLAQRRSAPTTNRCVIRRSITFTTSNSIPHVHVQPRLLSSTSAAPTGLAAPVVSAAAPVPAGPCQVPVTTYAWGDSGATVKIYVEDLAGLDTIDDGAVQVLQPDAATVELRVTIAGSVHVLRLAPLYMPIASATAKRSAKRVIVTLRKPEDGKTFTWYSLLGEKKKGGVGAGGAAAGPLSSAGLGEDFDLSAALGSTTGGLGPEADEDF